jgi:hypothetical protein
MPLSLFLAQISHECFYIFSYCVQLAKALESLRIAIPPHELEAAVRKVDDGDNVLDYREFLDLMFIIKGHIRDPVPRAACVAAVCVCASVHLLTRCPKRDALCV